MIIHSNCYYFRGDVPCRPHKQYGVHCDGCTHYRPVTHKILIIKLGAIGDVIRTTPLLSAIRTAYPNSFIYWITHSVDILPGAVDVKMDFSSSNILALQETHFDLAFNLDKDREACALLNRVSATQKKGFTLKDGKPAPIDKDAEHKFYTGVFDDVSKANTKSYPEEIFEVAGFKFSGEPYELENPEARKTIWPIDRKKKVVGLNTGCGSRWPSRLWPDDYWQAVTSGLLKSGYEVVLLGGEPEHEKNKELSQATGAKYFGHFPLKQFIDLIDQCHIVITQVTMAMHLAIGRKKRLILMNNIFNRHEFELYGLGEIIEPSSGCDCYYLSNCKREAEGGIHCMRDILPGDILSAVQRQATFSEKAK
ncbi:MAG: glycosyltransferase family 9 protein [Chlorobiales bacterium]|nr:glycosyltransferase family 9 protein [Chlorobiales bacterium]